MIFSEEMMRCIKVKKIIAVFGVIFSMVLFCCVECNAMTGSDAELLDIYQETTVLVYMNGVLEFPNDYDGNNNSARTENYSVRVAVKIRYNDENGDLVAVISTKPEIYGNTNSNIRINGSYGTKLDKETMSITVIVQWLDTNVLDVNVKNVKV